MKLDEKALSFEAQFPDLGPGEGVDFRQILEDPKTKMGHGKTQAEAFVVLNKYGDKNGESQYGNSPNYAVKCCCLTLSSFREC